MMRRSRALIWIDEWRLPELQTVADRAHAFRPWWASKVPTDVPLRTVLQPPEYAREVQRLAGEYFEVLRVQRD